MESSCDESGKDPRVLNLQHNSEVPHADSLPQSLGNVPEDAKKISEGIDLTRDNTLGAEVLQGSEALHSERIESSSDDDDDDFHSIPSEDETLRFKESNAVEDVHDAKPHSPVPEMKDAQSAMTSDHMERKSDKVEASQSSSGVTASEETANLFEKITNFRRRANEHLLEIYKDIRTFADGKQTVDFFQDLQEEITTEFGDIKKVVEEKVEDALDTSCPIVITGETAAGKSSFINLLLGVDLLPQSALSCTSTICRIHNSNDKKIEVTKKSKETKKLNLEKTDVDSMRNVLKPYVTISHSKKNQTGSDKEEEYEFVDIYWPIPFLQESIMIVDTPGIGPDFPRLTKKLFQYLPNALAFIYVINSANAGGVQTDRILRIQDELVKIRDKEKRTVFDPRRAVFICNKWDLVYEDVEEVFVTIQNTLMENWLGFQNSKLLKLSTREEMQKKMLSDDFRKILESIESMIPATIYEKIRRHLQWQQYFLDRVLMKLSTRIRNTHRSKEEKLALADIIAARVDAIIKHQDMLQEALYQEAEEKCIAITYEILNHLKNENTFSKMFDWDEEQLPRGESINEIKEVIDKQIRVIVSDEIMTKMKRIEIESLSDFVKSLFEWQQMAIGKECGELDRVFLGEKNMHFTFDQYKFGDIFTADISPDSSIGLEAKVALIASSPIWVPAAIVIGVLSAIVIAPVKLFKKVKNVLDNSNNVEAYNKDRIKYANERADKYLQKILFENLYIQIQNGLLKNIYETINTYFRDVIPKRIEAGKLLIKNIENDIRPPSLIRKRCHQVETEIMPIYGRLILAYSDLFEEKLIPNSKVRFPLKESSNPRHLCQAKLIFDGQWIPVHFSTITCASHDKDRYAELAEIHLLRKLQHQNIVVLYGFSVVDGSPGNSFHVFTEMCESKLEDEILDKHIPWKSRQRYLQDALKGIAYLHQIGFVHKNIRLSNILIQGSDAKLSMCGITEEVSHGAIEGIPIVKAPEVYFESYCGCESDMFQFSIVIWEAWYSKRAFSEKIWANGTTYDDFISLIQQGYRPQISEPWPQQRLKDVMKSCWQFDPRKRPSAERVLNELGKYFPYW